MKRTYRYLNFGYVFLILFLFAWSIPWMYIWFTQPIVQGHANGVPIYAPPVTRLVGLIGIPLLYGAIRLFGMVAFERIAIQDGEVVWTDWKGIERVRSPLAHVIKLSTPSAKPASEENAVTVTVDTVDGSFKFMSSIKGFLDLVNILEDAAKKNQLDITRTKPALLPYGQAVYSYRASGIAGLCIFMFVWSLFWTVGWLSSDMPFGIWLVAIPVFAIGVWTLLIMVNERVKLEGGDLVYVGCFGQTKLRCPLSEVKSVTNTQTMWGSGRGNSTQTYTIYKVHTLRGDFRFSEMLKNAADLRDRLVALSESNSPSKAELVPKVYSGWNPSTYGQLAVGLFLIVVGIYLLLGTLVQPELRPVIGSMEIAVGLAWSLFGLWSANRQIEFTQSEVIARDGFGRETLRSPLSEISLVDDAQIITRSGRVALPRIFQDRGEIARVLEAYVPTTRELI